MIARSVARAPIEVYAGEDLISSGPIVELLARPNPYMTQARFVETFCVQSLIAGNGYIRPEDGALSGETMWLLPVPPQQVSPIRDAGNPYALKGWRIQSRGGVRELGPKDLLHVPYAPDPNDPILGVSPVGVARLVVEMDYDAALYNQSILKNSGNLSGILKWMGDDPLTDDEVSALSQRWADNYSGADRAGKTAVLSGNFEFQPTSMPLKDMQYIEARRWNLADIARAFNVPLVFLNEFATSGLSDAGLRVQERMLYWQTVIPFARQIEQVLTSFVRDRFADTNLSVVFNFDKVEALGEETIARLEQAQKLAALGYPVNMINTALELGMPDVPWGNDSLVPAGQLTATAVVALSSLPDDPAIDVTPAPAPLPPPPADAPASDAPSQVATVVEVLGAVRAGKVSRDAAVAMLAALAGMTEAQALAVVGATRATEPEAAPAAADTAPPNDDVAERRAAMWRARDRQAVAPYRAMLGSVRKAMLAMRKQALEALDQSSRSTTRADDEDLSDFVSRKIDPQVLVRAVRRRSVEAFAKGVTDALEGYDIGVPGGDDAILFQLSRPEINKIAEVYFDRGLGRVIEIGERVRELVRDTLVAGQMEGEALGDLAKRVRDVFNASAARSTTIARTETQIAINGGAQERYKRQIPNGRIQWLSSRDSHVRDEHVSVDGEVVSLGAIFSNGLEHPCDPSGPPEEIINCRCYTIPIVEDVSEPMPSWSSDDE